MWCWQVLCSTGALPQSVWVYKCPETRKVRGTSTARDPHAANAVSGEVVAFVDVDPSKQTLNSAQKRSRKRRRTTRSRETTGSAVWAGGATSSTPVPPAIPVDPAPHRTPTARPRRSVPRRDWSHADDEDNPAEGLDVGDVYDEGDDPVGPGSDTDDPIPPKPLSAVDSGTLFVVILRHEPVQPPTTARAAFGEVCVRNQWCASDVWADVVHVSTRLEVYPASDVLRPCVTTPVLHRTKEVRAWEPQYEGTAHRIPVLYREKIPTVQ